MRHLIVTCGATFAFLLISCAPAQTPGGAREASSEPASESRTLVVAHRNEVSSLAAKALQPGGSLQSVRWVNATLALIDDNGLPTPYLAESLPRLNTDSWRVSPDGRMETTYRLRPNLTWHDGTPLTGEDFAFALEVYKSPDLGPFVRTPQNVIDAVVVPDPRVVVVRWSAPYAFAGGLTFEDLDPLPSHRLKSMLTDYNEGRLGRESFMTDPIWAAEYIGAGPYRVDHLEPGIEFAGVAFAGHVLGRPKIDRFVIRWFTDENQILATVLAGGTVHFTCCSTLRFAQYATLKREWESGGKGRVVTYANTAVFLYLQQRPEYVGHDGLLDLRVRRALAHAIDRPTVNEGLFDGLGLIAETPAPPTVPFYPELDRLLTRYALDFNRASDLMNQAGYSRDVGGFFADRQGRRFVLDFAVQNSAEIERLQAILSDVWKQAGFEVRPVVMANQLFQGAETRHTLPGLQYAFFLGEGSFRSAEIGTAANRWTGQNRSGWLSPEYDRLYDASSGTLDLAERGRHVAQMMALVSEQLPGYAIYFSQGINSWVSSLQGPREPGTPAFGQSVRESTPYGDLHEWTFRS